MKYILFLILFILVACQNEDVEYSQLIDYTKTLDSTINIYDITANCYRCKYMDRVIYEVEFIHTQNFATYFFSYQVRITNSSGTIIAQSLPAMADSPPINKIFYSINNLMIYDLKDVFQSEILITDYNAYNPVQ